MISFKDQEIDRTVIPQDELNITVKRRINPFTWNGQFSPLFVECMLEKFTTPSSVIIDPFAGSGTVLYESARLGRSAIGMELNPSAYFMSKFYENCNLTEETRKETIEEILKEIKFDSSPESLLKKIKEIISNHRKDVIGNILSLYIVLLDIGKKELTEERVKKTWTSLETFLYDLPYLGNNIKSIQGDSRKIPIPDDYADVLLTSPPYINVFNYHQNYRGSVEDLGYDVLSIARNEFGANRKHRQNRLLTVIQYCIDMSLSISEAIRVCKDKSRMIYVVGKESKVLGFNFYNSLLLYRIGTEIFQLPFILRQERVFKNRFGQNIFEDILHFENSKENLSLEKNFIISKAKDIAKEEIEKLLISEVCNKNYDLLKDCISKIDDIKESGESNGKRGSR